MIQSTPNTRSDVASQRRTDTRREVVAVCACDDNYAMPLNVMLHSAASCLSPGSFLKVYFLDGGLSEANWVAIKETLAGLPISVQAISPDQSLVNELHTSHHVTTAAYLRLLSAELMPEEIGKAIYLDSDLLIRRDLTELWDTPLDGYDLMAVPDIACPFIDARVACANFRRANPYLAAFCPVPNYRELGMDPRSEYFNSGVMVLDLNKWRAGKAAQRMLRCLEDHAQHVWCWDQYALNVVFHGRWKKLDACWNQGAHALEYPNSAYSPIDRLEFQQMLDDPAIIHFTTEFKPWHYHWKHLRGDAFFEALDQTSFRGWRPTKPDFDWENWSQRQIVSFIKWLTISSRKVASIWT